MSSPKRTIIRATSNTLLGLLALAVIGGCRDAKPMRASFDYSGIPCSVTLAGRDARHIRAAEEVTRSTAVRVLRSLDPADPKSDLAKLNKIAATARWPVPQDTYRALALALHYGRLTDGAFDITIAPLGRMWGLGGATVPKEPPAPELLEAAHAGVGMDKIALSDEGTIAFLSPLTEINLGEMAPAYALDMALVNIRRRSITNTLVRFGSSARCLGSFDRQAPWTEPIADPRDPAKSLGKWTFKQPAALSQCRVHDGSVTIGGVRYSAIIDPRTGMPVSNTLATAVSGPTATLAAVLARALMVAGLSESTNLLAHFPRYEALLVPAGTPTEIWLTDGFRKHFTVDPAMTAQLHTLVPAPPAEEEADAEPEAAPQEKAEMIEPVPDSKP